MTNQPDEKNTTTEQQPNTPPIDKIEFPTKEFSDGEFKLRAEYHPNCIVVYHIHTGPTLVKEATKEGLKKLAKQVTLPGFRKGKAPSDLILKKHPKAADEEIKKTLANLAFEKAQSLAKTPILSQDSKISFDVKELKQDDAHVHFHFETEPEIPSVDPSKFDISSIKKEEVDEQKVEDTIKQIQQFYTTYEEVTDKPVEEGHFVLLDIEDLDLEPPVKAFSDTRFEVKKGVMTDWMLETVVGLNTGDSKECVSRPNESDSEEIKKEFKPKKVKITIKKIEKAIYPEVNDEFAKKLGVDTKEEMYTQIRKQLEMRAEKTYDTQVRELLSKQMIENFKDFQIPNTLLIRETEHRLRARSHDPQFRKSVAGKSEEELKKVHSDISDEAADAIRLFYLSKKIVQEHKLQVKLNDEEFKQPSSVIEAMFQQQPAHKPLKDMSQEEQALQFSKKMLSVAENYLIEQLQKS